MWMRCPPTLIDALKAEQVNLDDPAVTVQLLEAQRRRRRHRQAWSAPNDNLATVGITCALCHSTVDDSFAPGIGQPSRWLGAIVR